MGVLSILLKADAEASEGLIVDYSFLSVSGVVAGFVDVCIVDFEFFVYSGL